MKFERNNKIVGVKDGQIVLEGSMPVEGKIDISPRNPTNGVIKMTAVEERVQPAVEEKAVISPEPQVRQAVEPAPAEVEEAVKPAETMEQRFAIPEFERKVHNRAVGVSYSAPAGSAPTVKILGKDIKSVEGVNSVPADAKIEDGVEIIGDVNPEVDKKLEALLEAPVEADVSDEVSDVVSDKVSESVEAVSNPDEDKAAISPCTEAEEVSIPYVSAKEIPNGVSASDTDSVKEAKVESATASEIKVSAEVAWNKLVDYVIVPTLNTCLDKAKEYVSTVLAADLKKSNPDA